MAILCCTSDFNNDGFLAVEDYRLYLIWYFFVDKGQSDENQKLQAAVVYGLLYPNSPAVVMTALPELDCADYNGDMIRAVEDYRLYLTWYFFTNKLDPIPDQLLQAVEAYAFLYPGSPAVNMVRRPELLDPANCAHGWFITPWHDKLVFGGQPVGWLQ